MAVVVDLTIPQPLVLADEPNRNFDLLNPKNRHRDATIEDKLAWYKEQVVVVIQKFQTEHVKAKQSVTSCVCAFEAAACEVDFESEPIYISLLEQSLLPCLRSLIAVMDPTATEYYNDLEATWSKYTLFRKQQRSKLGETEYIMWNSMPPHLMEIADAIRKHRVDTLERVGARDRLSKVVTPILADINVLKPSQFLAIIKEFNELQAMMYSPAIADLAAHVEKLVCSRFSGDAVAKLTSADPLSQLGVNDFQKWQEVFLIRSVLAPNTSHLDCCLRGLQTVVQMLSIPMELEDDFCDF